MVRNILYEILEDERILNEDLKLKEILDSYTLIELFSRLEDEGVVVYPTRINLGSLVTISDLERAIEEQNNEG